MSNLAASAVVVSSNGVLLVKRQDIESWVLPGGLVDPGETLAQAAIRETREETGLDIKLDRLVGVYSAPRWHSGGDHVVVFSGEAVGGELSPQPSEVLEAGFFDPDHCPEPMVWWHEDRIRDSLNGIGGSVARLQDVVWPFEHDAGNPDLRARLDKPGVNRGEFYIEHFSQRGPEDGLIEITDVRRQ